MPLYRPSGDSGVPLYECVSRGKLVGGCSRKHPTVPLYERASRSEALCKMGSRPPLDAAVLASGWASLQPLRRGSRSGHTPEFFCMWTNFSVDGRTRSLLTPRCRCIDTHTPRSAAVTGRRWGSRNGGYSRTGVRGDAIADADFDCCTISSRDTGKLPKRIAGASKRPSIATQRKTRPTARNFTETPSPDSSDKHRGLE